MRYFESQMGAVFGMFLLAAVVLGVLGGVRKFLTMVRPKIGHWNVPMVRRFCASSLGTGESTIAAIVEKRINVYVTLLASITGAGLVSLSVLASSIDKPLWESLSSQSRLGLIVLPALNVRFLLFLGGGGLFTCALFLLVPDTYTRLRRLLAVAIVLASLYQSGYFWMIVEQIDSIAQVRLTNS